MIGQSARREPDSADSSWRMPFSRKYAGRISSQPDWIEKGLVAIAVIEMFVGLAVLLVGLAQILFALVPSLRVFGEVQSQSATIAVGLGVATFGVLIAAMGFVVSMVATSGLFVTSDEVIVLNALSRHILDRDDIRSVDTGRNFVGMPCLVLETQDGRTVRAHYAGGRPVLRDYWALMLGYSHQIRDETDRLASGLQRRLAD